MAARRKRGNRRGRRRAGIPAWFWLLGGILIGLGGAIALVSEGYLPVLKQHHPSSYNPATSTLESGRAQDRESVAPKPRKPRYDFFTVLPEMEVVVPEQELSRQATPRANIKGTGNTDRYILQAGSFRSAVDAEQLKANLALRGFEASIQVVTVNAETWHRVRIGPFKGARKTDEVRRLLNDNQIPTLVLKANP